MFLRAAGTEVHLMGRTQRSLAFARELGFAHVWTEESVPDLPFEAVVDASNATHLPDLALDLVEPAASCTWDWPGNPAASTPARWHSRT